MQFVDGVTLRARIREGRMGFERVAGIMRQIGYALSAAHEKGVYQNVYSQLSGCPTSCIR